MKLSLDDRAREVACWLYERFREQPIRVRHELEWLAKSEGIDLAVWWHTRPVETLKIRPCIGEVSEGVTANCWTTIPEGSE